MDPSPTPACSAASVDAFQALAVASADGVLVLDEARRIRFINPAGVAMLGGAEDGLIGQAFVYPFTPNATEEVTLAGGVDPLPVELTASPTRWADGPATLVVLRDQTPRREALHLGRSMERQLRGTHRRQAAGVLATGLAHDFNNFLTVILGRTELMLRQVAEDDRLAHHVRLLHMGAKQHSVLTRQFLSMIETETSVDSQGPRDVPVEATLTAVAPVLAAALGDSVEVQVSTTHDVGAARVAPGRIDQMLVNLVLNARDAMPTGGRVRVTAEPIEVEERLDGEPAQPVELRPGRYVKLVVQDTGTGMPSHVRQRAFEPFFTTKRPLHAAGLGLSVVRGLAEEAGGGAWIESGAGGGTSVAVVLPGVRALSPQPPPAIPSPASSTKRAPVLLVEDETDVRTMLREVLEIFGYDVIEAEDGQAALEAARGRLGEIDLMLTDVVMPRMGGRATADRLWIDDAKLPVLFMSGYAEREIHRRGLIPEGAPYIQKPFTPDQLQLALAKVAGATA